MGTLKWPRFSKFYWLGGRGGGKDKVLCFYEDWLSEGAPSRAMRGTERDRESLGLLLPCFPIIRSLPFHRRPIWRRSAQHDDNGGHPCSGNTRNRCWHRARVETNGCTSKARGINRINERVHAHGRKSGCVHTVTRVSSRSEQLRYPHARVGQGAYEIVMSPSQQWERLAGYSDAEDDGNSRDGMTGDKNTRKENGKSSLKRNISKAVSHVQ